MFSAELMALNTELAKTLGDDSFVSSVFDRKVLAYTKAYLAMPHEERCALCRFALLEEARMTLKVRFSNSINEFYDDELKEGAKVMALAEPDKEAVLNAKRLQLDEALDKTALYKYLANLAVQTAQKKGLKVPAIILATADKKPLTATPIGEGTGLMSGSNKPAAMIGGAPSCCTIV